MKATDSKEVVKIYIPVMDIITYQEGFEDYRELFDVRGVDYTSGYMVVEREWFEAFLKETYDVEFEYWYEAYTNDETANFLHEALEHGKVKAVGIESVKEVKVG